MDPRKASEPRPLSEPARQLLVSNYPRFRAFLLRRTGSEPVAEEVLQGVLVRVLERGAPALEGARLMAWFYRVLRNALADHVRHARAGERALAREARDAEGAVLQPGLKRSVCQCLHRELEALKPEYAEAVRQVDLEERPLAEAAEASGITSNNAAVRLHRARQALKKRLEKTCGACAAQGCLDCDCARSAAALVYERKDGG
ncbi:RNA polymerase sigma-70 factor, ECF subfamily [Stigmatella aurantiaca]|uniref:RNA polymerase sigma factor n=1 Tax=Stigmatella aurantiaca TaxID=41 RepID=A0A1H7ZUE1_STIAU|nr:RNA polymerase sigma factor [Stigmatella aurantiaca]SEM61168.1 RNA polymerase sigma-70 factor, ECF subfamily [Stigmatella aurantiaca]